MDIREQIESLLSEMTEEVAKMPNGEEKQKMLNELTKLYSEYNTDWQRAVDLNNQSERQELDKQKLTLEQSKLDSDKIIARNKNKVELAKSILDFAGKLGVSIAGCRTLKWAYTTIMKFESEGFVPGQKMMGLLSKIKFF